MENINQKTVEPNAKKMAELNYRVTWTFDNKPRMSKLLTEEDAKHWKTNFESERCHRKNIKVVKEAGN